MGRIAAKERDLTVGPKWRAAMRWGTLSTDVEQSVLPINTGPTVEVAGVSCGCGCDGEGRPASDLVDHSERLQMPHRTVEPATDSGGVVEDAGDAGLDSSDFLAIGDVPDLADGVVSGSEAGIDSRGVGDVQSPPPKERSTAGSLEGLAVAKRGYRSRRVSARSVANLKSTREGRLRRGGGNMRSTGSIEHGRQDVERS